MSGPLVGTWTARKEAKMSENKAKLRNLLRVFSSLVFLFACLFFFGAAGDFYD